MLEKLNIKEIFKGFIQILLVIAAFYLFWKGFDLAKNSLNKTTEIGLTYATGVICLIFAFLTNFKTFKGLGVEAETWSQTQQEAEILVKNLKSLSVVVAEHTMTVARRLGRWGVYYSRPELLELSKRLEDELRKNGVDQIEIEKVKEAFHYQVTRDLFEPIVSSLNKKINEVIKERDEIIKKAFPNNHINDLDEHKRLLEKKKEAEGDLKNIRSLSEQKINEINYQDADKLWKSLINDLKSLTEEQKKILLDTELGEAFLDLERYCYKKEFRSQRRWLEGEVK